MPDEKEAPEFSIAGADNGVYVLFLVDDSGGNQCPPQVTLKCMFINFNGDNSWNKTVNLSSGSPKYDVQPTAVNNGICKIAWCDQRIDAGGIYSQNINPDGTPGYKPTSVDYNEELINGLGVSPNPVNTATRIDYKLPEPGTTIIKLYDALGNEIKTLVNEYKTAGSHYYVLHSNGLNSGSYFIRMTAGKSFSSKMIVIAK